MIRCNANLFRIATLCQSKEETRFYLQGVYVSPHAVSGVVLVTTDSHRLIAIHDETGAADESAIIRISPEALKACKPGRGERRDLIVYTGENKATVCTTVEAEEEGNKTLTDSPLSISHDCRIDGTFPDYRRVVPSPVFPPTGLPSFNGMYLADFGKIAKELEAHFDRARNSIVRVFSNAAGTPALIRFAAVPEAFGVLMPVRADESCTVPAWFNATPADAPVLQAAE